MKTPISSDVETCIVLGAIDPPWRFLPFVFEVHGGCTDDTAREIRHLLNAWSEQNGYDETRCAVNRHAWRYYIACMLAHAVQAQVRWLAEPMAASG